MTEYYTVPVCMKCRKFMRCIGNDIPIGVGVHSGHFHIDKYQCPTCKIEILKGWSEVECFAKCKKEIAIL